MELHAIDIELRNHSVYKSISFTCKNIYFNSAETGKQIIFLHGVNFSKLDSAEIAALMFSSPEYVEMRYGDSVNTMRIKMVDTAARQIKLER